MRTRKLNKYNLTGEYGIGYDCNNKIFLFDLEDYNKIKIYTWLLDKRGCVSTKINGNKVLLLSRLIMDYNGQLLIDHINQFPNDNRKSNLRFATKIQNGQNRKNVKGWRYEPKKKRFSARIVINKKETHLGYFDNEIDAREAYIKARKNFFGEFAPIEE